MVIEMQSPWLDQLNQVIEEYDRRIQELESSLARVEAKMEEDQFTLYESLASLARKTGYSKKTVQNYVTEMREYTGDGKRYPAASIVSQGPGRPLMVSPRAFMDFQQNRSRLRNDALRRHVKPYEGDL